MIRLGGPLPADDDPERWIRSARAHGYGAVLCPLASVDDAAAVRAVAAAAARDNVVIAEVGAWSNPLSPDRHQASQALRLCQERLDLAERIGASCCVNIAGSCSDIWDGPHADNFAASTFDRIVETVRAIIDAVRPRRARYCLETMPTMLPDSPETYLELIAAIDRPAFGAHLDPVNLVTSPRAIYATGALIRRCVHLLGPHLVSCHAKDIRLRPQLTVHLDEVRPGLGQLDYATYLTALADLPGDMPLILEHLSSDEEYVAAARHLRAVAATVGIAMSA